VVNPAFDEAGKLALDSAGRLWHIIESIEDDRPSVTRINEAGGAFD
jgi:hypothetical protein